MDCPRGLSKTLMPPPRPQAIGLNGCKEREILNNHRPCGHVDGQRSALLTGCVAVKIGLGTASMVVPRLGWSMASPAVVPRSSTARPHRCPQGSDNPKRRLRGHRRSRPALPRAMHGSGWREDSPAPGDPGPEPSVRWTVSQHRIVQPAALTPAFAGPYHRCFGAISAPDLCLPSTMTGLRESFP